jgi:hypothetical protein
MKCVVGGKETPKKINQSGYRKTCSHECFKKLCKLNTTGNYKPYCEKSEKAKLKAHALAWTIKSPNGITYYPYNLSQWLKDNSEILPGTPYQALMGFYHIKMGTLHQWKGWELIDCITFDSNMNVCQLCNQWYIREHYNCTFMT